jgi:hypothetical protein
LNEADESASLMDRDRHFILLQDYFSEVVYQSGQLQCPKSYRAQPRGHIISPRISWIYNGVEVAWTAQVFDCQSSDKRAADEAVSVINRLYDIKRARRKVGERGDVKTTASQACCPDLASDSSLVARGQNHLTAKVATRKSHYLCAK